MSLIKNKIYKVGKYAKKVDGDTEYMINYGKKQDLLKYYMMPGTKEKFYQEYLQEQCVGLNEEIQIMKVISQVLTV